MIRVPPQRGGWLEVICGPMFSGKSEEMIRRLRRAEIAGQRVVLFKPRIDDRYDAPTSSATPASRMRAVPVRRRSPSSARVPAGCDVVGIDEVQFFEHGDRRRRARARGRRRAGRSPPGSTRTSGACRSGRCRSCSSRAEFVDKLQAVCHRCGGPATTTQRLVDGQPAPVLGRDDRRRRGRAVRGALPRLPRGRRRARRTRRRNR